MNNFKVTVTLREDQHWEYTYELAVTKEQVYDGDYISETVRKLHEEGDADIENQLDNVTFRNIIIKKIEGLT
jgi:hypothetical protein